MKRITLSVALIAILSILMLNGCSGGETKSSSTEASASEEAMMPEWKLALEEIKGSMQDEYAQEFIRNLAEVSGGKANVVVYYYGELGTSGEITEHLQNGTVEMAFQSPGHLGSYVPEVQIFSLHYIMPQDPDKIQQVIRESTAINEILAESYRGQDLQLLDIFSEGWQIWSSDRPLRTPADFGGLKFRVMSSTILVEDYQAYGANVITIPYSEIYSALQLQQLDAQVQPYFAQQEMKFYEVQEYLTNAYQLMFICTFAASRNWWDGLTPEHQEMISQAIAMTREPYAAREAELNEERRMEIAEAKPEMTFYDLTPEEQAPFREMAQQVYSTYEEIGGPRASELLQALRADIAALE